MKCFVDLEIIDVISFDTLFFEEKVFVVMAKKLSFSSIRRSPYTFSRPYLDSSQKNR